MISIKAYRDVMQVFERENVRKCDIDVVKDVYEHAVATIRSPME